jgi:hypothetical protein
MSACDVLKAPAPDCGIMLLFYTEYHPQTYYQGLYMLFCRFYRFVLSLTLLPMPVLSDTIPAVPDSVRIRAVAIATSLGGKGTFIKEVSKAAEAPGLHQATQVIYTDSNGALQNLIMLPDGIHFIAGPIGIYDPTDRSISDINRVKHIVPTSDNIAEIPAPKKVPPRTEANNLPTDDPFKLDGIFRYSNFTTAGKSVFKDPVKATENYFSLLSAAKGIKDGKSGHELFILFDPSCGYCLLKYEELRPLIDTGKLTVYWIPVVGPSLPPYTNLLLLADPNLSTDEKLERLKLLTSKRSIPESAKPSPESSQWLKRSTSLLAMIRSEKSESRSAGTPQMFYRGNDGILKHQFGYSSDSFEKLVSDLDIK